MKKFTVKASALAIAAALPGLASAVVDLDTAPLVNGPTTYASELVTAGVTGVTVAGGVQSQLGFGVSQNQDRYIRYDLGNAKFNAAVLAANLEVTGSANCAGANTPGDAVETVVQGGASQSTSVIFQITANVPAGLAPTASCVRLSSSAFVLNSVSAGATMTYQLYETAADAVAGGSAGRLAFRQATIAGLAPGLAFSATTNLTTADVVTGYKKFTKGVTGTAADANGVEALIGNVTVGTNPGVKNLGGANDVLLTELITLANLVVGGADFSASSNTGVTLDSVNNNCATPGATVASVTSSTVRTIGANGGANGAGVCFTATANTAIAAQNFTVALDVISAANGSTAGDLSSIALGMFDRDGTVLKAPIMTGAAGQSTWVQLANVGNVAAAYTVRCFAPSGAASVGAPGSVSAGNTVRLFYNNLACAAGSNAAEFTFSVPSGNVVGTLVRQSTTSGDSALDSLTGNQ